MSYTNCPDWCNGECNGAEHATMRETPAAKQDAVSHPAHYTTRFQGAEVIQITRHLNFKRGNIVKYVTRAGFKEGEEELTALKKALWYLNDEIARVENGAKKPEK